MLVILTVNTGLNSPWIYFCLGFLLYFLFHIIFFRPVSIYVFGHELTHAIAGIVSGAKIKSFIVKKNSGNVTLTKTNIFITLAPYFIPIYSLIIIILYWIIKKFWLNKSDYYEYFLVFLGISVSFHIFLTIYAIRQGQSDLKIYGFVNSLLIVFIANCLFLSLLFSLFFQIDFINFIKNIVKYTAICVLFLYRLVETIFRKF